MGNKIIMQWYGGTAVTQENRRYSVKGKSQQEQNLEGQGLLTDIIQENVQPILQPLQKISRHQNREQYGDNHLNKSIIALYKHNR